MPCTKNYNSKAWVAKYGSGGHGAATFIAITHNEGFPSLLRRRMMIFMYLLIFIPCSCLLGKHQLGLILVCKHQLSNSQHVDLFFSSFIFKHVVRIASGFVMQWNVGESVSWMTLGEHYVSSLCLNPSNFF